MDIRTRVHKRLSELDASFEVIEIDPALADTAAFCEAYGYGLDISANAILIASKRPSGYYALCLALATTRLDVNHRVRDEMGVKKLSFASADTTRELTGMEIGGVTPFGMDANMPVLVDAAVTAVPRVVVGGGDRASKIIVDPEVFGRMDNTEIVSGLAAPFS